MKTNTGSGVMPLKFRRGSIVQERGTLVGTMNPNVAVLPLQETETQRAQTGQSHALLLRAPQSAERQPAKPYVLSSAGLHSTFFWEQLVFGILGGSGVIALVRAFFG